MTRPLLALLAAVAMSGCTAPQPGHPTAVPPESRPLVTPSAPPATTTNCAQVQTVDVCDEWRRLDPQPSFYDMLRLTDSRTQAPGDLTWAALYFCGALPKDLLAKHLGENPLRTVASGFVCSLQSADEPRRDLEVHLGIGTFDMWTDQFTGQSKQTTINNREALILDNEPRDELARHEYVLAIPQASRHVIVVKAEVWSTYDENNEEIPVDQQSAQRFAKETVHALIALSTPR